MTNEMYDIEVVDCPLCGSSATEPLLILDCGKFDKSALYETLRIKGCKKCGHVYNELTSDEVKGLMLYYDSEYSLSNISAPDNTGDRPGSSNYFTLNRYRILHRIIGKYACPDSDILDVGCAMGGFLDYLRENGFSRLFGIDPVIEYVKEAERSGKHYIKLGNAEAIPFDDNYFDLVVMDQVLEHVIDIRKALREVKRVLRTGGHMCISVPDASRYGDVYFFDFYWFLLREHIHHFDIEHLRFFAKAEGFDLIEYVSSETPMMSEAMLLPNLTAIFRLNGNAPSLSMKELLKLEKILKAYVEKEKERLFYRRSFFKTLNQLKKELYAWGISREFLYLYAQTEIGKVIHGLVDVNPYKQLHLTIGGKKINPPSILRQVNTNSGVIITAVAHKTAIKTSLRHMGYKGEVVEL